MMEMCEFAISNAEAFAEQLSRELQVLDGVSAAVQMLMITVLHCETEQNFAGTNIPCCFARSKGKHPVHHGVGEAGKHPDAAAGRGTRGGGQHRREAE